MLSTQKYGENLHVNYSPFGTTLYGRNWSSEEYRYGFQSFERDDEVAGKGNHYTGDYWEYSPRLVRRWNVDPDFALYPFQSPYAFGYNNPIVYMDFQGRGGKQKNTASETTKFRTQIYKTTYKDVEFTVKILYNKYDFAEQITISHIPEKKPKGLPKGGEYAKKVPLSPMAFYGNSTKVDPNVISRPLEYTTYKDRVAQTHSSTLRDSEGNEIDAFDILKETLKQNQSSMELIIIGNAGKGINDKDLFNDETQYVKPYSIEALKIGKTGFVGNDPFEGSLTKFYEERAKNFKKSYFEGLDNVKTIGAISKENLQEYHERPRTNDAGTRLILKDKGSSNQPTPRIK